MELNREQIIKALECCGDKNRHCSDCTFRYMWSGKCIGEMARNALSLIKELTEENERLREDNEIKSQKRANIFEIVNAFDRGRTEGVRKMQQQVKALFAPEDDVRGEIDKIAKNIMEGVK